MRLPQTMTDEWFMDEQLALPSLDEGSVAEFVRSVANEDAKKHWVIGGAVVLLLGLLFAIGSGADEAEPVADTAPSATITGEKASGDVPQDFVLVADKRIVPMDPK